MLMPKPYSGDFNMTKLFSLFNCAVYFVNVSAPVNGDVHCVWLAGDSILFNSLLPPLIEDNRLNFKIHKPKSHEYTIYTTKYI